MEHESRTRLVTALVLAAVFVTGVILGIAVDSNLGAAPPEVVVEATGEGEGDERPRRRPLIYEQVHPTAEQHVRIDSIVAEHRARTSALDKERRAAFSEGFRVIILETREAIKGVFTQEQAAEYQRLIDDYFDERAVAERENRDERD